jgi:Xaa-Pro dipeptidase
VALNEHGAVLHYQYQRAETARGAPLLPDRRRRQLRRLRRRHHPHLRQRRCRFAALVAAVDRSAAQPRLAGARRHRLRELHVDCHRQLAGVLRELDIVRMTPDAMLDTGVTSTFFPHGLGHLLGLQVHDVGGFQRDENGGAWSAPTAIPICA